MPDIRAPIPQRQAEAAGKSPKIAPTCPECLLRNAFYKEILTQVKNLDALLRRSDIGLAETVGSALVHTDLISKSLSLALSPAGAGGTPPATVPPAAAPIICHGK